jgi:hypothetical protein
LVKTKPNLKIKLALLFMFLTSISNLAAGTKIVMWDYDSRFQDTLESQTELGGEWTVVPPPYALKTEADGSISYAVTIPNSDEPQRFFRVARIWGAPLTSPSTTAESSAPVTPGR